MHHARKHTGPGCATTRSAVSNRSRLLDGVDGRTTSARRFRDLVRAFEDEVGGHLSEVDRGLIRQAAALSLRAEQLQTAVVNGDMVDSDQLIRLSGTAKRILSAIAAKASKRKASSEVSIDEYLSAGGA